jgi:polyphenol oxidase
MPSSSPSKVRLHRLAKHEAVQAQAVREIDNLFGTAGLVRNLRGKAAGVTRRARLGHAMPDELSSVAPIPSTASNGIQVLRVPDWDKPGRQKADWLWHGFSTRKGGLSRAYCADDAPGELNLGFTSSDDRETVAQNRRLLVEAVTGNPDTPLITLRQIHSSVVVVGAAGDSDGKNPHSGGAPGDGSSSLGRKGDGLMTDEPGLLLGIQTADCIPVLVADRKRRVVAAFHAGWRGTVKRIVEGGVGRMRLEFGSRPEDLIAAIGPGVGACCYAVGDEVLSSFESQFTYAPELFHEVYDTDPVRNKYPMLFLTQRAPGHSPIGPSLHVDLVEANRRQLLDAGLKPKSIHFTGGCTSCQPELFFSHRASRGHAGRMMSVIGIRPR